MDKTRIYRRIFAMHVSNRIFVESSLRKLMIKYHGLVRKLSSKNSTYLRVLYVSLVNISESHGSFFNKKNQCPDLVRPSNLAFRLLYADPPRSKRKRREDLNFFILIHNFF